VIVGESIALRYPDAQPGKKILFGKSPWDVVGIFHAAGQAANSEVWCDFNQLAGDYERPGGSSSLLIRLESPANFAAFKKSIEDDQRLGVNVLREKDYYAGMTESGLPLEYLGFTVAVIMAVGAAFAATNTMYAAVSRRSKEIGTLRALGFSRAAILLSFIIESVCLALIGGLLGVLLALPINGLATGIGNFATFTDVTFKFRVSPMAMFWGLAFAAMIGALGGFLPAYGASRKDIVQAMRDA
jgi:ABC-type lipoprotein release transport system permease subunit